jgi:hypothetical protein
MNTERKAAAYAAGRATAARLLQADAGGRQYFHDAARCLAKAVGMTTEQLVAKVVAYDRERLDAVPDLTVYPELRGYRERLDEETRGMREGGLDDASIALCRTLNFWRDTRLLQETGRACHVVVMPEKCRVLYVPQSDVGAIHAKNVDDPLTYWRPRPPFGPNPAWPWQHPLLFDGVGSGLHLDEIPPEIFPVNPLELCREHCTTVPAATEFLVRYNYFWHSQNLLIHDYHGNSMAFEKTRCRVATRGPNAQGINFITGMGALDPGISAFQRAQRQKYLDQIGADETCSDACFWRVCWGKWHNMARYVEELSLSPTFDNVKQLMEQRDPSGPMCLTGVPSHPTDQAPGCTLVMDIYLVDRKQLHRRQWRGKVPAFLDTPERVQFV